MSSKILVVDDEQDFLDSVRRGLTMAGFKNVDLEKDPRTAAALIERGEAYAIALLDITMPHIDGVELLELIKRHSPNTECIMVTALNEVKVAVECIKKGAYDYLLKPVSREDLVLRIKHALERKRLIELLDLKQKETCPELTKADAFRDIVTRSPTLLRILKEAELHAASDVPVLITGESGTGKELLAMAIHRASPRADMPFTPVNMGSLSDTLFDAEFFGHTKGAFSGAEKDRAGYLHHTNRGTLFLDEIGILPPTLQGKLLRVLQEGEFLKLGSSTPQKVDIRFIAATNHNLERLVSNGTFRNDLYYRLRGAWLHLPPLRERREDIPVLINRFLQEFQQKIGRDNHTCKVDLEERALEILLHYNYPGNVRELRALLQAAVNLAQGGTISIQHLPDHLTRLKLMPKSNPQ